MLVVLGGYEGAEHVARLLSSQAWLNTAVDWIQDNSCQVFATRDHCDYEQLLSQNLVGYDQSTSLAVSSSLDLFLKCFQQHEMVSFLSKLGPGYARVFLYNETNQVALLELGRNEGWQALSHLIPDHPSSFTWRAEPWDASSVQTGLRFVCTAESP